MAAVCVWTPLALAVLAGVNDTAFGMNAGSLDDRPQMLEVCFLAELTGSLLLIASPNLAKLGRAFFLSFLAVAALAFVGAWHHVLHPLDGAPPLSDWYPIWLTALPLALSLYTVVRQYHPTLQPSTNEKPSGRGSGERYPPSALPPLSMPWRRSHRRFAEASRYPIWFAQHPLRNAACPGTPTVGRGNSQPR